MAGQDLVELKAEHVDLKGTMLEGCRFSSAAQCGADRESHQYALEPLQWLT